MARKSTTGYRVDLLLHTQPAKPEVWINHTSRTALVSLWFAGVMAEGLNRQGAECRIVRIQNGTEEIVAECKGARQ